MFRAETRSMASDHERASAARQPRASVSPARRARCWRRWARVHTVAAVADELVLAALLLVRHHPLAPDALLLLAAARRMRTEPARTGWVAGGSNGDARRCAWRGSALETSPFVHGDMQSRDRPSSGSFTAGVRGVRGVRGFARGEFRAPGDTADAPLFLRFCVLSRGSSGAGTAGSRESDFSALLW